jgi:EAL domain-containing protein (putative c-di-GMP-specific phosphodiesterase class I)
MDTVSACLRAHSADGDTVARIDRDRYGLVHDAGLDLTVFEKELESVVREVDPAGKGISIDAATLSLEDGGIGEEDMAKSLLFVVNRLREAHGGQYTLKSLSNNLPELMSQAVESVEAFKTVIAKSAFNLAFQPIVDVHTGGIHHYEALVRFGPAGKGNSSPFRQISFAEEVGLIDRFDLEVVKKAIGWLSKKPRNTRRYQLAVNISGHSVGSDYYVSSLHKLLRDNPWVQGKLMFEITESSRMTDLDRANDFIQGLRKEGYPVCLDDFGAGAASFQYLSALEVDIVKLDGSAVRNTYSGSKGKAFLSSLAALCKSLGVETVAEMVEKRDILTYVRECGIDFAQGYLFGEPSSNIKDFDPLPRADLFRRR